jgi:hypothetical protein
VSCHVAANSVLKCDVCWSRQYVPGTRCPPSLTAEAPKCCCRFLVLVLPFRLVTCGLAVSHFAVACPNDPGMLDVAGFDAEVPRVIEAFSRGAF